MKFLIIIICCIIVTSGSFLCLFGERRCTYDHCVCLPSNRDTSGFNTLNTIGNAIGNRNTYNPYRVNPPSFSEINNMYQTSRDAHRWNDDWSRKHALRY